MTDGPEYLFIDSEPGTDDIRGLLREMAQTFISKQTKELFVNLSVIPPVSRLARNLSVFAELLVEDEVNDILKDGLRDEEINALLELDVQGLTKRARVTARSLLNVKERWIMSKTMSGLFRTARETDGGFIECRQ